MLSLSGHSCVLKWTSSNTQWDCCHLVHRVTSLSSGIERQMEFSSYVRPDYLARRIWSPNEMEEFYEGRRDFLWYRKVIFQSPDQIDDSVCWKTLIRRINVLVSRLKESNLRWSTRCCSSYFSYRMLFHCMQTSKKLFKICEGSKKSLKTRSNKIVSLTCSLKHFSNNWGYM